MMDSILYTTTREIRRALGKFKHGCNGWCKVNYEISVETQANPRTAEDCGGPGIVRKVERVPPRCIVSLKVKVTKVLLSARHTVG